MLISGMHMKTSCIHWFNTEDGPESPLREKLKVSLNDVGDPA